MRNWFTLSPRRGRSAWLLLLLVWLAGPRAWAQTAPGWQAAIATAGNVQVQAVATDASGRVLLAGSFGPGSATFGTTTLTTAAAREVFVAKWNPATSSFVWAVQGTSGGSGQTNVAYALAVNGNGIYLAGGYGSTTLRFGNTTTLTNAQSGRSDVFVAKLTDDGPTATFAWGRRAGGTGNDVANAVAVGNNFVYVGGRSEGGSFDAQSVTYVGGFVARCSEFGGSFQAPVVSAGYEVTALAYGGTSVYAAGRFTSTSTTFSGNGGTVTSQGNDDSFVVSYGATLVFNWLRTAGGTGADSARGVAVSGNSVYVAGSFGGASIVVGNTTLANNSISSSFVAKLAAATGAVGWALQSTSSSSSSTSNPGGLAAFGTSLYLAGTVGGTVSYGGTTLTSAGSSDVLLTKIIDNGSSGAFAWAKQAGSSGANGATSVAFSGREVYVGGQVTGPAAFGSLTVGTAGTQPGFLAAVIDPAPVVRLAAPTLGPVGTPLTLYGSGFSGATAVTFAGTSNNVVTSGFTVNAAGTQLSGVVVPAGAQTGAVDVTTPQGVSNSLVSYTVTATANPAPAWQAAAGATGNTSYIRFAATDASGNVFVVGVFSGTIALGSTSLTSAGYDDLFIAKWSPASSSYVWAVRAGGTGYEYPYGLVATSAGIYLAGYFDGPTAGFGNLTLTNTTGSSNDLDGFVVKLTDAGSAPSFSWAQLIGGDGAEFVEALAVSGSSVYVGGDYTSTTLLLGSGSISTPNASADDGFVAKFTDNGSSASFNWALRAGDSFNDYTNFYALAVRGNSVYASGYFLGTVTYGSFPLTSAGNADAMVVRITDLGNSASYTAATRAGGTGSEFINGLQAAGNGIYLGGNTSSISSTWGSSTISRVGGVVAKLTDTGTSLGFTWAQAAGNNVYQVAANGSSVYAAGTFAGTSDVGGAAPLYSAGGSDGFVTRLTDAGSSATVQWAQQFGGLGSDIGYALALSSTRVLVAGSVVPAAAFGTLPILAPLGGQVAALGSLPDPALLAATPAAAPLPALTLYPNPAHTTATVQLPAGASTCRLLDPLGREVRRQPVAAGAAEVQLDLRGLAPGLYLVRVLGSGPARTHHLLVE